MPFRSRTLSTVSGGAILTAILTGTLPAEAADIRGRVVNNATNNAAASAIVTIEGTSTRTVADDDGSFELRDVSPGAHVLVVRYIGLPETRVTFTAGDTATFEEIRIGKEIIEELVVSGQREADRKALQAKLAADQIEEVLYSDDVGKLPDQNVAEAVKRLPGISVANDQGEGRYVVIRGVSPNLANVSVNGQQAPVPEPEGRQIKLDDIPSSLIGSIKVIKSLTPDRDANAIAGEVEIDTLSAFDFNRTFANARVYYGRYDMNGKNPYGLDATAGSVFGSDKEFGAVVSINFDRRPIESQNIQGSANWRLVNGFTVPDDFRLRDYNLVRKRQGAVLNLDWKPADTVKLHLRSTYSKFSDNEYRDQVRYEIATPITNQTATGGTFASRSTLFIRRRIENDKTFNFNFGGEVEVAAGELKGEFSYGRAEKRDPLRSEFQFRTGNNAIPSTYDVSVDPFIVTPGAQSLNTALYGARQVNYDTRLAVDNLFQFALDYTHPLEVGDRSTWKIGAKYTTRKKNNDRDFQAYTLSGFTADDVDYLARREIYDGRYPYGPRIDYYAAQKLVTARPTTIAFDLAGSRVNDLANDYQIKEKVVATYAMTTLKFGALTVIPGVRMEHTSNDFLGKLITPTTPLGSGYNTSGSRSYTNWFPGVNVRYDVDTHLVLRAAVTTAIARPNFAELAPYISVDTGAATVTQGNPNLKALKAVNGDLSAEYYLPNQGVLSVSAFYKHIDDPTYLEGLPGVTGTYGGLTVTNALVTTPRNADKAIVKGIELNAQTQLTFLPSPLDGFGIGGTITFVSAKQSGLFGRTDEISMPLQSKRVAAAQVFYEKHGFTARLAYSYRSPYLDTVGAGPATDQFTDSNGQLDAKASYEITHNVIVFTEASNLTDAPWRRYVGVKAQLAERERYGWSLRGGVQIKY